MIEELYFHRIGWIIKLVLDLQPQTALVGRKHVSFRRPTVKRLMFGTKCDRKRSEINFNHVNCQSFQTFYNGFCLKKTGRCVVKWWFLPHGRQLTWREFNYIHHHQNLYRNMWAAIWLHRLPRRPDIFLCIGTDSIGFSIRWKCLSKWTDRVNKCKL